MKILKRYMLVSMLIATFVSLLLTAGVASATSRIGGNWRTMLHFTVNTGMKSSTSNAVMNRVMTSIVAVSANNIWAVGYSFTSNGPPQTLIEHWIGTKWSVVSSPNVGPGDNYLYGVAAISASNLWAVGNYYSQGYYHMLIEHWNGTNWSVVSSPSIGSGNHLQGVAAVSQNSVWIVGYYYNGSVFQTLIEHWNGTSWSVITSPNVGTGNNYLMSISAVSATNIWAVGHYDHGLETPGYTLIEHWNGTRWSVVSSPNVGAGGSILWGVATASTSDSWAVGEYYNGTVYLTLIEHWNGTQWSVVSSPNVGTGDNILNGVAAVSASDAWAVGSYVNSNSISQTLIEHWNGTRWSVVSSPNVGTNIQLLGVAVISASNAWAVGSYLNAKGHFQALIEHWNGFRWSVVPARKS